MKSTKSKGPLTTQIKKSDVNDDFSDFVKSKEDKTGRDLDNEAAVSAFRCLVERLEGCETDKKRLITIMERMLRHDRYIPGNALFLALPYNAYLKTSHWQKVRQDALKRASFRCSLCNAEGELHCHHRTYENVGYEQPMDVICLCKDCHDVFHKNRKAHRNIKDTISKCTFTNTNIYVLLH